MLKATQLLDRAVDCLVQRLVLLLNLTLTRGAVCSLGMLGVTIFSACSLVGFF